MGSNPDSRVDFVNEKLGMNDMQNLRIQETHIMKEFGGMIL